MILRIYCLLLISICSANRARSIFHNIHWESTNKHFETFDNAIDSPGYYEIQAESKDIIKLHCPKKGSEEVSIIYKVNEDDFMHCSLSSSAQIVGECSSPSHSLIFHFPLKSQVTSQIYFITTSTGDVEGLKNRRVGLCVEKNMRLAVQIGSGGNFAERDALEGMNVDVSQVEQENIYLAEEMGELSWKKNVLPPVADFKKELQEVLRERRLKLDQTRIVDPSPIDDELVNKWEEARRRQHTDMKFPQDVRELSEEDLARSHTEYHFNSSSVMNIYAVFLSIILIFIQ